MFDNYCFSNYFSSPESNKKEIVEEQSDPKKSATTTIRTNMSTMKSRSRNTNYEKVNSSDNDDTFTEKPIVVTGGASDLYSKFKRRHRFKLNPDSTTVSTPTTYAQVIVNIIGFFIKNLNKECVFQILWKSSCYTWFITFHLNWKIKQFVQFHVFF